MGGCAGSAGESRHFTAILAAAALPSDHRRPIPIADGDQ